MNRHLPLILLAAAALWAQPSTVTVNGPIYAPDGQLANGGTISATLAAPCVIGGQFVVPGPYTANILADGTVSVPLVPTGACETSGNSYAVRIVPKRFNRQFTEVRETWTIPASPSTTTIAAVRTQTVPAPLAAVSWLQLTSGSFPAPITAILGAASANTFFGGPTSGSAVASFRALTAADIPTLSQSQVANLIVDLAAKAGLVHVHAAGDVTTGVFSASRIPSALNATTVASTLSFSGQTSGNSPYLQANGSLFDLLMLPGGFRVLNNAGTLVRFHVSDVGVVTVNGIPLASSATVDATNASNISTGTLPNARTTATSANLANAIVARDASGQINVGTIDVNGNALLRGYNTIYGNSGLVLGAYYGTGDALFSSGFTNATDLGFRAIGRIGFSTSGALAPHMVLANAALGVGTISPTISGTGKLHASGNTARVFDAARTPGSSGEACNIGEMFFDASYLYVCIGGSIKRIGLGAF